MSSEILKKAYVGMQCFWGVESSFAQLKGVLKTRVGYAGGQTPNPTYYNIADHTEITELQYDENITSYKEILNWFFSHHDCFDVHKKQYQSAILYVDSQQKELAENAINEQKKKNERKEIQTYLQKFDRFYQAEDYHQKYWLRCQSNILKELKLSDEELVDSTLAAKVNAYLGGYQDFDVLTDLQKQFKLDSNLVNLIRQIAEAGGDPRSCH